MRMRNAPLRTTCRTLTLVHQTGNLWQNRKKKKKNFPNLPFTCLCCKTLSVSCSPSIFQALYLSLLHVHREEPGLPTAASLHCTSSSPLLVGRKTLCIIPVNSIQSGSVAEMIFIFWLLNVCLKYFSNVFFLIERKEQTRPLEVTQSSSGAQH